MILDYYASLCIDRKQLTMGNGAMEFMICKELHALCGTKWKICVFLLCYMLYLQYVITEIEIAFSKVFLSYCQSLRIIYNPLNISHFDVRTSDMFFWIYFHLLFQQNHQTRISPVSDSHK